MIFFGCQQQVCPLQVVSSRPWIVEEVFEVAELVARNVEHGINSAGAVKITDHPAFFVFVVIQSGVPCVCQIVRLKQGEVGS